MAFINENIKKLRIAKGYKQDELGDLLDKRRGTVSKIENGSSISFEDAIKTSKIFDVSLDDLANIDIDVKKVIKAKKIELSHYNIKSLHPTIDKDFNNLPHTLKEFGKAMTLEMYRQFTGVTIEQLKQEVTSECIDSIVSTLRGTYNSYEEITVEEVIESIDSLKPEIE
ncbi:helix-turn-helix transcriptional regulator [Clostridium lacusfryxellense]|uniref:helix-turn-helix transcriptional regulator n=1 Tax=Clostridium lacusfryxellense TaxID=205328 RepID=UPI001C0B98F0|nr:helix-turn-helix transcriptional regulator [Clostridium lacusfryxellense]MBU3114621.1 helix-turn-helix domain-containing protein [Clostridium lacusfryxellense]